MDNNNDVDKNLIAWCTALLAPLAGDAAQRLPTVAQQAAIEKCAARRTDALRDRKVTVLLDALRNAGCPLSIDRDIRCVLGPSSVGGRFTPNHGIELVAPALAPAPAMVLRHTLTHELIHAYDYATAEIDLDNPRHVAYSELRAAALSGECILRIDDGHGFRGLFTGLERCVKRRARTAILTNPRFKNVDTDALVNELYPTAIRDTQPFDTYRLFNLLWL